MPIRVPHVRLTGRTLAAAVAAALMSVLVPQSGAHGAAPREGGPVHSYDDAIRESDRVGTRLDGDGGGGGRSDRVDVDTVRTRDPAQHGRKLPVAMDAGPNYSCCGRGNESRRRTRGAHGNPVAFPPYGDHCFVQCGCGFVAVDLAGSSRSTAAADVGSRSDVQSAEAAVGRLNGHTRAFTTRTGTQGAAPGAPGTRG
ncbi:hypothetical protein QMZ92_14785 [Streptomyces sp. HNM0645]|uniref:hypothetical protein n=1 Tax=Streptomyces sp. HNM0645 TaxID=2782343 RepID=UPI0024B7E589|nr:hypothetical protein [Streptomyces sp. HNM0645]MDI9885617.1 hypothetical protein [Streptomyces sp. HNM0645]